MEAKTTALVTVKQDVCLQEWLACVCRRQNRIDTDFRPHAAGKEPHFTFIDSFRGICPVRSHLFHSPLDSKPL